MKFHQIKYNWNSITSQLYDTPQFWRRNSPNHNFYTKNKRKNFRFKYDQKFCWKNSLRVISWLKLWRVEFRLPKIQVPESCATIYNTNFNSFSWKNKTPYAGHILKEKDRHTQKGKKSRKSKITVAHNARAEHRVRRPSHRRCLRRRDTLRGWRVIADRSASHRIRAARPLLSNPHWRAAVSPSAEPATVIRVAKKFSDSYFLRKNFSEKATIKEYRFGENRRKTVFCNTVFWHACFGEKFHTRTFALKIQTKTDLLKKKRSKIKFQKTPLLLCCF